MRPAVSQFLTVLSDLVNPGECGLAALQVFLARVDVGLLRECRVVVPEQRSEVQRVPCGAGVVVGLRVGGCSVLADPAVGRAGQGDEQGGPEGLAVRRRVGLAYSPGVDRAAGQRCGVLPPLSGAVAARPGGEYLAAEPGLGDLLV